MFVRNSAQRNSLSERMKGLGRDVKKKIAARLKSRGSKDEEVSTMLINFAEVLSCFVAQCFFSGFSFSFNEFFVPGSKSYEDRRYTWETSCLLEFLLRGLFSVFFFTHQCKMYLEDCFL